MDEVIPGITLRPEEHCESRPGEHYTQYKSDGEWNDVALSGNSGDDNQTKGYIVEYSTNFPPRATCNLGNPLACVNFYLEQELVLDDDTFQNVSMLDYCDPSP